MRNEDYIKLNNLLHSSKEVTDLIRFLMLEAKRTCKHYSFDSISCEETCLERGTVDCLNCNQYEPKESVSPKPPQNTIRCKPKHPDLHSETMDDKASPSEVAGES